MPTKIKPPVAAELGAEKLARDCVRVHPRLFSVFDVVDFESDGQTLIVRGAVPTFYLKQILQEALRELPGIARVDNQVDVTPRK